MDILNVSDEIKCSKVILRFLFSCFKLTANDLLDEKNPKSERLFTDHKHN